MNQSNSEPDRMFENETVKNVMDAMDIEDVSLESQDQPGKYLCICGVRESVNLAFVHHMQNCEMILNVIRLSPSSFDLTNELMKYARSQIEKRRDRSFFQKLANACGSEDLAYMEAMLDVMEWSYERSKQLRRVACQNEAE